MPRCRRPIAPGLDTGEQLLAANASMNPGRTHNTLSVTLNDLGVCRSATGVAFVQRAHAMRIQRTRVRVVAAVYKHKPCSIKWGNRSTQCRQSGRHFHKRYSRYVSGRRSTFSEAGIQIEVLQWSGTYFGSAAVADIGLPKMFASYPTFTPEACRQQCGVDFEDRCAGRRPSTVADMAIPLQSVGLSEFQIADVDRAFECRILATFYKLPVKVKIESAMNCDPKAPGKLLGSIDRSQHGGMIATIGGD